MVNVQPPSSSRHRQSKLKLSPMTVLSILLSAVLALYIFICTFVTLDTNDAAPKTRHNQQTTTTSSIRISSVYPPPPVSCPDLFSTSAEQTRLALASHPELAPPSYDSITGKNTSMGVDPNAIQYRDISLQALDPNFGTLLANRHANAENGEEHVFSIAMHRPEIDRARWGLFTKGKYYEFWNTRHFMDIIDKENKDEQNNEKGEGGIVLDVGMNIGWFTLLSAAMGAKRVIAFDPLPMHHFRVCQSIKLNGWDRTTTNNNKEAEETTAAASSASSRVETYHVGVGAKRGILPISYELTQLGKATFWADKPSNGRGGIIRKDIDIVTLDDFATSQGWLKEANGEPSPSLKGKYPIPLLKVDVEGYEYAVFDGAWNLIRSGLVKFILAEYQFFRRDAEVKEALKRTASAGYKLVFIGDWSGGAGAFQKAVDNKSFGGFPTDYEDVDYPEAVTKWAAGFFEEHKRWKRANLMWARNEVDVDGVFSVLKK